MDPQHSTVEEETARAEQLALNCRWLIDKTDAVHAALCPGKHGTWQQRAEQGVAAAKTIVQAWDVALARAEKAERELAEAYETRRQWQPIVHAAATMARGISAGDKTQADAGLAAYRLACPHEPV